MVRKVKEGGKKPSLEDDTLRLFCISEDYPYKPRHASDNVVILTRSHNTHVCAAYDELSCELFGSAPSGSCPKLFILEAVEDERTLADAGRSVQKFLKKLGFDKMVFAAEGAAVPLALQALTDSGVQELVKEAVFVVPRGWAKDKKTTLSTVNVPIVLLGNTAPAKGADESRLFVDRLRKAFGSEERAAGDRYFVAVDFLFDVHAKVIKPVTRSVELEVAAALAPPVDTNSLARIDATGDAPSVPTLTSLVIGASFSVVVQVLSAAVPQGDFTRWRVGDATGTADAFAADPKALVLNAVVAVDGVCTTVEGRLALLVRTVRPAKWAVPGYEPWITLNHVYGRSTQQQRAGLVVLRGAKTILSRSVVGLWEGVRIPVAMLDGQSTARETAMDAFCRDCDLHREEIFLPDYLCPHSSFADGVATTYFIGFASRPPPPDADDDFEESEDEDDDYDWFTLGQALERVTAEEGRVLREVSDQVSRASVAGALPRQWDGGAGGVFGQKQAAALHAQEHGHGHGEKDGHGHGHEHDGCEHDDCEHDGCEHGHGENRHGHQEKEHGHGHGPQEKERGHGQNRTFDKSTITELVDRRLASLRADLIAEIGAELQKGSGHTATDDRHRRKHEHEHEHDDDEEPLTVFERLSKYMKPQLRFEVSDRVLCNVNEIGGENMWVSGTVHATHALDPDDPGATRVTYVVMLDYPPNEFISVMADLESVVTAEKCFGQREGALSFTLACMPRTRKSVQRFKAGDRVACAVEDATDDAYTVWAAGTVLDVGYSLETEATKLRPSRDWTGGAGIVPYRVELDNGSKVMVHRDEHWLVRDLALQPEGLRQAADGSRNMKRVIKRRTGDSWEIVDHMTRKVACEEDGVLAFEVLPGEKDRSQARVRIESDSSDSDSTGVALTTMDLGFDHAVIIIGAGAAGIGTLLSLTDSDLFGLDPDRVLLLERGEAIGSSFRMWPKEMRFISPSFNQAGWTNSFDLNAVAYGSSPAYTLHAQHPSGSQYADYLDELAKLARVRDRVQLRTEVDRVVPRDGGFDVHVRIEAGDGVQREETLRSRYVVWAAGEFQYPRETSDARLSGAELCLHNSRVQSWASLPGDDFVLIGGYESGVDAAVNLAKAGKRCTVLASTPTWNIQTPDPSSELAPYTAGRLRDVTAPGFSPRPELLAPLRVQRVEKAKGGGYNVIAEWKATEQLPLKGQRKPLASFAEVGGQAGAEGSELVMHTAQPPVLCTGFQGSLVAGAARDLFDFAEESDEADGCLRGAALLTQEDESTKVPGVFLVGPAVSHGQLSFCFVYKFRQRFGIVADAICRGLGRDTRAAVATCRRENMYLDELRCCEAACESC